jgi:hypothetical protein
VKSERSAAAETVMMTEPATGLTLMREALTGKAPACESVMSKLVVGEAPMAEVMMVAHRVPRETSISLVSVMRAMMMMPPTMMTMAGPTAGRPFASLSVARPTVVAMSPRTPVSDKLEPVFAAESLAAPTTMCFFPAPTETRVARMAPSEGVRVTRPARAPCAAMRTKTDRPTPALAVGTRSATPRRSSSRSFRTVSFGSPFWSARARLPGDVAIRTPIVPHLAAVIAIAPIGVAHGTLFGGVPPFRTILLVAIVSTTPSDHGLFVAGSLVTALCIASRKTVGAMSFARSFVVKLADSASAARLTIFVRTGTVARSMVIRAVGHFVGSHFTGGIGSPIAQGHELQHGRCCDSSKKHQRVVTHPNFLITPNAGSLLRIDAVTDLGSHLHSRPWDVSRPRLGANINQEP